MPDPFAAQRGHLFPWAPVALGCGIGGYLGAPAEPGPLLWAGLALGALLASLLAWRGPPALAPLFAALALAAAGALLAGARTHQVAAPVLGFRYYGPIEGTLVHVDRALSDKPRLTLAEVWLEDMPAARMPAKVRLSLHGALPDPMPAPGARVMTTGHLSPPAGPAQPGGFDFRFNAWFAGLGAVGYTRNPVVLAGPPARAGPALWVARFRAEVAEALRARMPGAPGAFAAAIIVGDRATIPRDTLEDLRQSNLAHLLAISGLHMGLLTGLIFAAVRGALALVPALALRLPVKQVAAVAAMAGGAAYLALSGASVATQRAFIMVCVVFAAVLLNRRALTLRAVALAGLIVLVLRPESLVTPGFQMSFAATAALVAAFGLVQAAPLRAPSWAKPVLALVLSSAVAGLATAPYSAAHFNQMAPYGLIANLAAVPAMGLVVMPGAVAAALLAPFGLEGLGLWPMARGIDWIVGVAGFVAGLEGAARGAVAPPRAALPLLTIGALVLLLWQGRGRALGLVPLALAAGLWAQAPLHRPALLIAESGGVMGLMGPSGRALSHPRGNGFATSAWLEDDGDTATQQDAAARPGFERVAEGVLRAQVAGLRVVLLRGRGWRDQLGTACAAGDLVVIPYEAPQGLARRVGPGSDEVSRQMSSPMALLKASGLPAGYGQAPQPAIMPLPAAARGPKPEAKPEAEPKPAPPCMIYDSRALARTGALAITPGDDGPVITAARAQDGLRPWTGGQKRLPWRKAP